VSNDLVSLTMCGASEASFACGPFEAAGVVEVGVEDGIDFLILVGGLDEGKVMDWLLGSIQGGILECRCKNDHVLADRAQGFRRAIERGAAKPRFDELVEVGIFDGVCAGLTAEYRLLFCRCLG
jgi:hypothetical protein